MPKQKTNKGAAKRFKVSKNGKITHKRINARHLLTGKSAKRKRRLRKPAGVSAADAERVRQLLPYG